MQIQNNIVHLLIRPSYEHQSTASRFDDHFCDVDDFYIPFEAACNQSPQLPYDGDAKPDRSRHV